MLSVIARTMIVNSVRLGLSLILALSVINICLAIPTPQEITTKITENNAKILDLQATMVTTIKSSMLGGQPITQRATFYKKGTDKSRVEMTMPALAGQPAQKQIAITNGDESWTIGNDGLVVESPAKSPKGIAANKFANNANNTNATDPTAYLKYFDLTVEVGAKDFSPLLIGSDTYYLITGTPKAGTELSGNQYFGSIKMYIDKARFVPVLMQIYKPAGANNDSPLLMETTMSYVQIKDLWINDKSTTKMIIDIPDGKDVAVQRLNNQQTMEIVVEYKGLKVNEGLGDGLFRP